MDGPEPDNYAIYPSLEGKQLSYSFIIKDYEGKGAFTNDQKRILHEKFGLLDVHVETLSIYVGNCLDIGSLNNLSKVTRPKAIEKGRKQVKKRDYVSGLERTLKRLRTCSQDLAHALRPQLRTQSFYR